MLLWVAGLLSLVGALVVGTLMRKPIPIKSPGVMDAPLLSLVTKDTH